MDADTAKLVIDLADRLTTIGFMLMSIAWLVRENNRMKELLFGDWKRQREEEIENRVKQRLSKELTTTGL